MKSPRHFVSAMLLVLLIPSVLGAVGNGDINVTVNHGSPWNYMVKCGLANEVEIWIQNDAPLVEISLGLRFSSIADDYYFVQPYGNLPVATPVLNLEPWVLGSSDMSVEVDISQLPNEIYIHAVADQVPLPARTFLMKLATLQVVFPSGGIDHPDGFCIDNNVNPSTGEWSFNDGTAYAPDFAFIANTSVSAPDAPAKCFDTVVLPCAPPVFTAVPPETVIVNNCENYSFDFNAVDMCDPPMPIWYTCSVGAIDSATGVYSLGVINPPDTVHEIVEVFMSAWCGVALTHEFTVIRNYGTVAIAHCRPELRVKAGTARAVDFDAAVGYQCDQPNWGLTLLSENPPASTVGIDPQSGIITVEASPADLDLTFDYRLTADAPYAADTCTFQLSVIDCISGDADGNGIVNISDVVTILNYVFSGGLPPACEIASDADCSGSISISDAVFLINYIFSGGPEPC